MQERLKLDLYQKTSISQGITTRVNDGGQHEIQATALAYGDVFDLTDWKIKFELTTSVKTISIDAVNAKITAAKEGNFHIPFPKKLLVLQVMQKERILLLKKRTSELLAQILI